MAWNPGISARPHLPLTHLKPSEFVKEEYLPQFRSLVKLVLASNDTLKALAEEISKMNELTLKLRFFEVCYRFSSTKLTLRFTQREEILKKFPNNVLPPILIGDFLPRDWCSPQKREALVITLQLRLEEAKALEKKVLEIQPHKHLSRICIDCQPKTQAISKIEFKRGDSSFVESLGECQSIEATAKWKSPFLGKREPAFENLFAAALAGTMMDLKYEEPPIQKFIPLSPDIPEVVYAFHNASKSKGTVKIRFKEPYSCPFDLKHSEPISATDLFFLRNKMEHEWLPTDPQKCLRVSTGMEQTPIEGSQTAPLISKLSRGCLLDLKTLCRIHLIIKEKIQK